MAYETFVGSLTQPGSTGNQVITGISFQPKAVIFTMTNLTSDGSASNSQMMIGWAVSSTQRAVCTVERSVVSASATSRHDDTKCITVTQVGGGLVAAAADIVTMNSDGFTINWTTADATARIVSFMALGGSDMTNAAALTIQSPVSTGTEAYTGVGFTGTTVMFIGIGHNSAPPSNLGAYGYLDFGVATATAQAEVSFATDTGGTSEKKQISTKCYMDTDAVGGIYIEAEFVSFDVDGFTVDWTTVAGSAIYVFALVLQGGQVAAGVFDQPGSTGVQAVSTSFQPAGLLLCGFNAVAGTTIITTNARKSFGFTDGSNQAALWIGSNASASSDLSRSRVIKHLTEGTPTLNADASISSFGATDFSLNWASVDATARQVVYLAFGAAAAVAVDALDWLPQIETRRWPHRILGY